jgi:hypothetical protein
MYRRRFLAILCLAPAVPRLQLIKKTEPKPNDKCGLCGSPGVFDNYRDINFCPTCGAQETSKGWEKP